ncbi:mucin-5AC-like [Dreissena polymorpha]|uniref:Uncharacterized protein n=1 Tax=Dreissena polymorpha TaxID=45954 RepID=A0A9D4F5M6_DREPO|nr:mucin-5AC-like [Dreissena polymorpha]KAH3792790.1 hypothetical protein DPMN_146289 [Dreissena polymorpha]
MDNRSTCASTVLAQDCVIPSGSQFSRATYRPYHVGRKTFYNAGERLRDTTYIRVVCNKDRQGDAVLKVSNHLCSAGNWSPPLPVCQGYKRCRAPPRVENATASERITPYITFPHQTVVTYKCNADFDKHGLTSNVTCVDGEWTSPDNICNTTTTAPITTILTTTTTHITTDTPITTTTTTAATTTLSATTPITTSPHKTTNSPKTTTISTTITTSTTTTKPIITTTTTFTTIHKATMTSEKKESIEITNQTRILSVFCEAPDIDLSIHWVFNNKTQMDDLSDTWHPDGTVLTVVDPRCSHRGTGDYTCHKGQWVANANCNPDRCVYDRTRYVFKPNITADRFGRITEYVNSGTFVHVECIAPKGIPSYDSKCTDSIWYPALPNCDGGNQHISNKQETIIIASVVPSVVILGGVIALAVYCCKLKRKQTENPTDTNYFTTTEVLTDKSNYDTLGKYTVTEQARGTNR